MLATYIFHPKPPVSIIITYINGLPSELQTRNQLTKKFSTYFSVRGLQRFACTDVLFCQSLDSSRLVMPLMLLLLGHYSSLARNRTLSSYAPVVTIPKSAVLSVRSCRLAKHIPFAPYGLEAQLALALALYGEL
jgi:hypothetical protein